MAILTTTYSATGTAITCVVTSLAAGAWRASTAITNATNQYVDVLVGGNIEVDAQTADGTIEIYAYASADGGTTYSGGLDGTTATITWGTTQNTTVNGFNQLVLLGVVDVDATDDSVDVEFGPFSLSAGYGMVPEDWGIVVRNNCDGQFDATGSANTLHYSGIKYTST
jgi:hypothetical protein